MTSTRVKREQLNPAHPKPVELLQRASRLDVSMVESDAGRRLSPIVVVSSIRVLGARPRRLIYSAELAAHGIRANACRRAVPRPR